MISLGSNSLLNNSYYLFNSFLTMTKPNSFMTLNLPNSFLTVTLPIRDCDQLIWPSLHLSADLSSDLCCMCRLRLWGRVWTWFIPWMGEESWLVASPQNKAGGPAAFLRPSSSYLHSMSYEISLRLKRNQNLKREAKKAINKLSSNYK